ncbi:MAG: copper amine oxidase N-terminal domain-containing protein [Candidatus Shapirobacteria bacterium]|nr:copper amine oxidase N-terminal domain-containing protein [Candidatus Shapirobacteria bacterium]MDD3002573.1 copper amine oxidase N-terminal domain-containing protein [Candidatus Shapirobacteria bacterium]MDD4383058.1 copper amine oxidase N-terminal domain-containing protein [Candidatus Shapirobacteria bacterium]
MKKEIAAAGMVGVLTFTGVGSAFAASPIDDESINGGDKDTILKDPSLSITNRHDAVFKKLGIVASTASAETQEQVKTDQGVSMVLQIDNSAYFVSSAGDSVEAGVWKKNDTAPVIINNRTMVPLRLISETLGADVNWNSETNSITVKKDNKEINVQIGSDLMLINDQKSTKEITLDSPPVVDQNNRTLVPVRAIAEAFEKSVIWDQATNSIFINYTQQEKTAFINNPNNTGTGGNTKTPETTITGTPEQQRVKNNLKNIYDEVINGQANPFNLDDNEVKKYLETGSDEGLKSFQVVKSKETSFIMITGEEELGLNKITAKIVKMAVKRWDEIDPSIMKEMVETNGLRVVTYRSKIFQPFQDKTDFAWSATFDKEGTTYLNQYLYAEALTRFNENKVVETNTRRIMEDLLVESYGIYYLRNLDKNKNIEVYKAGRLLEQVEKYKSKLTPTEYSYIKNDAENNIRNFSR